MTRPVVTDAELLRSAIDASGIVDPGTGLPSVRGFARKVLDSDDSKLYKVLKSDRALSPADRVLCQLVILQPDLVSTIGVAVQVLSGADRLRRVHVEITGATLHAINEAFRVARDRGWILGRESGTALDGAFAGPVVLGPSWPGEVEFRAWLLVQLEPGDAVVGVRPPGLEPGPKP